jgi:hypothetical protein
MAEKLKAIAASTPYDEERARIVARIAELDDRLEYIEHMLAANRAVMLSRTCKLQDKVKQLRTALHLVNGGSEQ